MATQKDSPFPDGSKEEPIYGIKVTLDPGTQAIFAAYAHDDSRANFYVQGEGEKWNNQFTNSGHNYVGPLYASSDKVRTRQAPRDKSFGLDLTAWFYSIHDKPYKCTFRILKSGEEGGISYTWYKAWAVIQDGETWFTSTTRKFYMTILVATVKEWPECPISTRTGTMDGLLGKLATFKDVTENTDPADLAKAAEGRVKVDFNYQKIPREKYVGGIGDQHDKYLPDPVSVGKPHHIIVSIPSPSKSLAVDKHDVRSFLNYHYEIVSDGEGGTRTVVRQFPIAGRTIRDEVIATAERMWHNHRTASCFLKNPEADQGVFVFQATLTNGAQAWEKSSKPNDFPFEGARLNLLGVSGNGVPGASSKVPFMWTASTENCSLTVTDASGLEPHPLGSKVAESKSEQGQSIPAPAKKDFDALQNAWGSLLETYRTGILEEFMVAENNGSSQDEAMAKANASIQIILELLNETAKRGFVEQWISGHATEVNFDGQDVSALVEMLEVDEEQLGKAELKYF